MDADRTTWPNWRVTYTSFDGHIPFNAGNYCGRTADDAIALAIARGHIGKNHKAEVIVARLPLAEALVEMERIDLAREAEDEAAWSDEWAEAAA